MATIDEKIKIAKAALNEVNAYAKENKGRNASKESKTALKKFYKSISKVIANKDKKASKPRSKSAYIIFCAEERPKIKEEHPDMAFGDLSKELGVRWNRIKDTPAADKYHQQSDEGKEPKDKTKKVGHANPYMLFSNEHREAVTKENPGKSPNEIVKILGEKWTKIKDTPKAQKYRDMAAKIKADNAALKSKQVDEKKPSKKSESKKPSTKKVEDSSDSDSDSESEPERPVAKNVKSPSSRAASPKGKKQDSSSSSDSSSSESDSRPVTKKAPVSRASSRASSPKGKKKVSSSSHSDSD